MTEPLATYLHDHLAGSTFAISLLDSMQDEHAGQPLGDFAEKAAVEIREDQDALKSIIEKVGESTLDLKGAIAWAAEKLSQLKLRRDGDSGLGTLETLETLGLGILGKHSLWRALAVVAETDVRLQGIDFARLGKRALAQHAEVETHRLEVARKALTVRA
jgi:hypothetical protein